MRIVQPLKLQPDEKEFTPVSFCFLLLSDLFILYILFFGLSQQIKQLTNEYEYFPHEYRMMLIEQTWVENNAVDLLTERVLSQKRSLYDNERRSEKMHPTCRAVETLLTDISCDEDLGAQFEQYERLRNNYEYLSAQEKNGTDGESLAERIRMQKSNLLAHPKVQNALNTIFAAQKVSYVADIAQYRRFFALKRVALDFLFLLPVIALFIVWNRISFKKNWSIALVVSSHFIVLAFIPILFEILRLVVEIIPKILLKAIYDFLLNLNLVAVWYYAVIVVCILLVVGIIWLLQTKIFTKAKYNIKRYANSKCMNCNTKIDYSKNFCPVCGTALYTECPVCKKQTLKDLNHCTECGASMR